MGYNYDDGPAFLSVGCHLIISNLWESKLDLFVLYAQTLLYSRRVYKYFSRAKSFKNGLFGKIIQAT